MKKGREKSDRRIVPGKGGNAPGGRATTASKRTGQLDLFSNTADSPQGDVAGMDMGRPMPVPSAVPKLETTTSKDSSTTLTIEEWALSHCAAVDRGLRNAYLADRGLESLEMQWRKHRARNVNVVPAQLELW